MKKESFETRQKRQIRTMITRALKCNPEMNASDVVVDTVYIMMKNALYKQKQTYRFD